MKRIFAVVFALVMGFLGVAFAGSAMVSVRWTFATTNVDGTDLTDLAGARVYVGTSSSNYVQVVDVPGGLPGETKSYTVTGLVKDVTYYFNGTAYNTAGLESDFCNEISRVATNLATRPMPPDGLFAD